MTALLCRRCAYRKYVAIRKFIQPVIKWTDDLWRGGLVIGLRTGLTFAGVLQYIILLPRYLRVVAIMRLVAMVIDL